MRSARIAIRGGGDLGSGVALRLWRCGFRIVLLETERPIAVRRSVAFSEAVYEGVWQVEEAVGRLVATPAAAIELSDSGGIPVLVDPSAQSLPSLTADAMVDAIMAKRNTGTSRDMAARVIGLGPGFVAGRDVHAVVETNRGPNLGRVIWDGPAEPDTGRPGAVAGKANQRVLRAPASGIIAVHARIGDIVEGGAALASVNGLAVRAPFSGVLRGMIRDGLDVPAGMKIGDIDPRTDVSWTLVSDKALAIAGGVIEALMSRHEMDAW